MVDGTGLTLDEELFLLSRDPGTGRNRATPGIDAPLAGAVLIELADAGTMTIEDGRAVAHPGTVLARDHLRDALALMAADAKRRTPSHWISRLPGRLRLQERVGLSLTDRGVLRGEHTRVLGVFPVVRFPEQDPAVRQALAAELRRALTGADPDPAPRVRLLAGLAGAAGLVNGLVDRVDRRAARNRATAFLKEAPVGKAVSDAVAAAAAATTAAVTAAVAAAAASTSGGG